MRFPCSGLAFWAVKFTLSISFRAHRAQEIGWKERNQWADGGAKAKKQFWGFLFYLRATNEHSVNVLLDVEGMLSIPPDSVCTNYQINFRKFPQKCRRFLCFSPSKEHVINIFGNKNNCHYTIPFMFFRFTAPNFKDRFCKLKSFYDSANWRAAENVLVIGREKSIDFYSTKALCFLPPAADAAWGTKASETFVTNVCQIFVLRIVVYFAQLGKFEDKKKRVLYFLPFLYCLKAEKTLCEVYFAYFSLFCVGGRFNTFSKQPNF